MDIENELTGKLRRLDASGREAQPGYDYAGLLGREAARVARHRRRVALARGTASALVLAMVGLSVWRLEPRDATVADIAPALQEQAAPQPRLVRADSYFALEALEDHIASIDDALSDARVDAPRGAEVARLERTRAELLDSYAQVRYAQLVSANY